jgi:hypothetical protein
MKKHKVQTRYEAEDLAQIITDMFRQLESPEGERFKVVHILKDTIMISITEKTFIVNVIKKDRLS